jgi:hypothetical protein
MEMSKVGIKERRFGIQELGFRRRAAARLIATSDNNISVWHGALVVAPPMTPFALNVTATSACCLGLSAWLLDLLLQLFQLLYLFAQCLNFRIFHLEELQVEEKRKGLG